MQQVTSRQLYAYWDGVRNGRVAPRRFEIEPAKIAALLPETFIAERSGASGLRFRLAGTKICEHFGCELRGIDLLNLWSEQDRKALLSLLSDVFSGAAVGEVQFRAETGGKREVKFELLLLPLIHTGEAINRVLGSITALETPFWLGAAPLARYEIIDIRVHWPDGGPPRREHTPPTSEAEIVPLGRARFHVYDGGLAETD